MRLAFAVSREPLPGLLRFGPGEPDGTRWARLRYDARDALPDAVEVSTWRGAGTA